MVEVLRRMVAGFVVCALACVLPAARSRAGDTSYTKTDAMVAMDDGVTLDTSVYVPAVPPPAGGFPLIVRQHGGGSNKDSPYDVAYGLDAVATGRFALLMYSHRGHGNSGGVFDFFGPRTTRDFSEVLDWAANAFPGVIDTGNVGVIGYSQGGGESLLPAEADHRVKAVAVGNTFDDLNHALNPNDCFKAAFASGIFVLAYNQSASRTDDATAIRWGATWYGDTEDAGVPGVAPSTTDEAFQHSPLAHLVPDAQPGSVYREGLHVPVFWSNSWEDNLFPADHPDAIVAFLRAHAIPTHLWFASGGHEVAGGDYLPDQAGKEAAMLDWFDEFLLGEDRGFRPGDHGFGGGERPLVDYAQRVPGGEWTHKTATDWPPSAAAGTLVPSGDALCIASPGHGCVAAEPLGRVVNTIASANSSTEAIETNRAGPFASQVPDSPNPLDTLTFTSAPLGEAFESTGAPAVRIDYASTATRVAQFDVKIFDVDAGGGKTLAWRGCMSDETPGDGLAGFSLWPNSHVFASGHRVQLTVSTVDAPTFKPDTEPQASVIESLRVAMPLPASS